MRTLVWFRGKELRLADHAPLFDAVVEGEVLPLFVVDPFFFAKDRAAQLPHRMQFLLDALRALQANLAERGSRLLLVEGRSVEVVPRLAAQWRVDRVVAHRWSEPFGRERDARIRAALQVPFDLYEGETLMPPGTMRTGGGTPYSVFTPFARAFARTAVIGRPVPAPKRLPPVPADVKGGDAPLPTLESLGLPRNPRLLEGGERAARARLAQFLAGPAEDYLVGRNQLDAAGTSRLSADLKFGTLSVRTVWHQVEKALGESEAARSFQNELIWRDFTHHTLHDRPEVLEKPFREDFHGFPWIDDDAGWRAWVEGRTGYPVIDAAARQLLGEGFVHNRARMITASFLTKHLLIDYRRGEAHFLKYLTDGDWAQNNAGWQWSAGCGSDAQPYFRVFNPVTQGERFDPSGGYVRRWVPELAKLPVRWIHAPWEAPPDVLRAAGVTLGSTYPLPVVEHAFARTRFLEVAGRHLRRAKLSREST